MLLFLSTSVISEHANEELVLTCFPVFDKKDFFCIFDSWDNIHVGGLKCTNGYWENFTFNGNIPFYSNQTIAFSAVKIQFKFQFMLLLVFVIR